MTPRILLFLIAVGLTQAALAQNPKLITTFTNPVPTTSAAFGWSVAAVGSGHVIIGAYLDDTGATDAGAAYLFSTNGALLTTFTNPTPAPGDSFGISVAAMGSDRVLVGAHQDDLGWDDAGAVYLFNTNGTLLKTLSKPTPKAADNFGLSIASLGNDRILVGAILDGSGGPNAGGAYLFDTNGIWLTTFTNPTPAVDDRFGQSLAAVGTDRVIIGAHWNDTGLRDVGAAYLYSTNGSLLLTFANPTPNSNEFFGYSVAAMGTDRLIIGALQGSNAGFPAGAVYLFSDSGNLLTTIRNPTPNTYEYFGTSVAAMGNDRILVGASNEWTEPQNGGAAYLFSTNGTLLVTINNPTPAYADFFGQSVAALGNDWAIVGAHWDDEGATDNGATHFFFLELPTLTILPAAPGNATISWTPDTPGFELQETEVLSPANWTNSPSGDANPTVAPATSPAKYFRLRKP